MPAACHDVMRGPRHRLTAQINVGELNGGIDRLAAEISAEFVDIAVSVGLMRKPSVKNRGRDGERAVEIDAPQYA